MASLVILFRKRRWEGCSRHYRCNGDDGVRFARHDHPDASLREPSQEAVTATAGDQNIKAVDRMRRAARVLMNAHFLRQIEFAGLTNVSVGGFKDHETTRFSCMRGNGAEILARDANLHAFDLVREFEAGLRFREALLRLEFVVIANAQ